MAQPERVWRVGVLAVHGMGQQQRHQQLAECAEPFRSLAVGEPELSFYTHRGRTEKRLTFKLNLPPGQIPAGYDRAELEVIELYWAHLVRGGTNLLEVLVWFGWAVYRELLPQRRPPDGERIVAGDSLRFAWLGLIVLWTMALCALVCTGLVWFGWASAAHLYSDLVSFKGGPFCWGLTIPPTTLGWILGQWIPFLVFSVSARAAYQLLGKAYPKIKPSPLDPSRTENWLPRAWRVTPFVTSALVLAAAAGIWNVYGWIWCAPVVIAALWFVLPLYVHPHSPGTNWHRLDPPWRGIWHPLISLTVLLPFAVTALSRYLRSLDVWMISFLMIFLVICLVGSIVRELPPLTRILLGVFGWLALFSGWLCICCSQGLAGNLTGLSITLLFYSVINLMLVHYFGDITIFITQAETSSHFAQRQQVLGEARAKLEYLFGYDLEAEGQGLVENHSGFHSVAIVAHSLGCPVSYEVICRYFNNLRARASKADTLAEYSAARAKFAFFATCGCILEIVKFYFARRTSSVKLYDDLDDMGYLRHARGCELQHSFDPALHFPAHAWLNLRSEMDPFTWPGLRTYGRGIMTHIIRSMVIPVHAHMTYFQNSRVAHLLRVALLSHGFAVTPVFSPTADCEGPPGQYCDQACCREGHDAAAPP